MVSLEDGRLFELVRDFQPPRCACGFIEGSETIGSSHGVRGYRLIDELDECEHTVLSTSARHARLLMMCALVTT